MFLLFPFFKKIQKSLNIVVNKAIFCLSYKTAFLHLKLTFCKEEKKVNFRKKLKNRDFWLKMTNVTKDKTRIFFFHRVFQCETKFLSWVLILQKSLVLLKMLAYLAKAKCRFMSLEINYLTIIFPPKSQNNMEKCLYVICSLLNPTVGNVSMLSLARRNLYKMVVFPDASKPNSTILAGLRFTHCEIVDPIS